MNIAVDPRGRHAHSLGNIVIGGHCAPRSQCAADSARTQGLRREQPVPEPHHILTAGMPFR
jgi:hypothetical protein